jgi:hypothetical protein
VYSKTCCTKDNLDKKRRKRKKEEEDEEEEENTKDVALSISPAPLQYGISNVFITCDECL